MEVILQPEGFKLFELVVLTHVDHGFKLFEMVVITHVDHVETVCTSGGFEVGLNSSHAS